MPDFPWTWPDSTLVHVVDGDTFDAKVTKDIGFHGTVTFVQRLRLAGVNAPKISTEQGESATAALYQFLARGPLTIQTFRAYKYGDEWMAKVTNIDGKDVSEAMIRGGFAVPWDGTGPRPGDG